VAPVERSGVLILRVWIETEGGDGLRARVVHERRLGSGERVSLASADVDEIVAFVEQWLVAFVEDVQEAS